LAETIETLISEWSGKIDQRQRGHFVQALRFGKYHYAIGMPAVVCATVAGATLFSEVSDARVRMAVGAIGLIAAVLSAIQTFYSHAARAEQHRTAAAQLGRVRRDVEILARFLPADTKEQEARIRAINESMAKIEEEAPVVGTSRVRGVILTLGR